MTDTLRGMSRMFKKGRIDKESYIRRMHDKHARLWEYCEFIRDKNVESITIRSDHLALTTKDGVTMICDREDERSIPMEILNFGDYETAEMRMLRTFVKKDSVVLDIGANIGWHSLNLSRHMPHGRIIAFEPAPGIFSCLKKNLELNKVRNVEARNYGLSDAGGSLAFYYDPALTVATSMRNLHAGRKKKKIYCRVRRLDDLPARLMPRIDLIKCDVEGAELFVMKGALKTIRRTRPVLFLEMLRKWSALFGYHPNDIIGLLAGVGYRCYAVKGGRLMPVKKITGTTQATNFYFLDPEKHAKFLTELT